jgi:hypothetical protein
MPRKKADGFTRRVRPRLEDPGVPHRHHGGNRGWLFGEHPLSITAGAKQRGDLRTDQISMVRIWLIVLAFIVAFLPTLMVEIGFPRS